jgi:hypothetical protein
MTMPGFQFEDRFENKISIDILSRRFDNGWLIDFMYFKE